MRYRAQRRDLELWLERRRLGSLAELSMADDKAVNAVLAVHLQQLAADHVALYKGGDLLSGFLKRFPWYRGRSSEAWRAFAIRSRATPRATRLSLDYVILRALVCAALLWRWRRVGALLVAGFHGLLRPAELSALNLR